MELRHLRYFLALAEELNFTRAAQRVHISQPPFSMQISQLEQEIGVDLLVRTSRHVELTPAGRAFLHDARAILEQVDAAGSRARAIGTGSAGRIEIGLASSHFLGPLPRMISTYMQRYPEVSVVLHELKPTAQIEQLRNRRIDLSVSRTPINDAQLVSTLLWDDPMLVALPRGHALAGRRRLSLHDLRNERFVMLRLDSSAYAQHMVDCCVQAGFAPQIVQAVSEVPAVASLVAAGIGIGLIPESVKHLYAGLIAAVPLRGGAPKSGVYAVLRREEGSGVINEFVRLMAQSERAGRRRRAGGAKEAED
jgi:DNA-binding transcriptional LysR family regulator